MGEFIQYTSPGEVKVIIFKRRWLFFLDETLKQALQNGVYTLAREKWWLYLQVIGM